MALFPVLSYRWTYPWVAARSTVRLPRSELQSRAESATYRLFSMRSTAERVARGVVDRYDVGGLEAYAPTFASVVALPIARDDDLRTVVPRATAMVRIRSIFIGCCSQAPSRWSPTAVRSGGTCPAQRVAMLVPVLDERADGLFVVPSPRVERRVSITFRKVSAAHFSPAFRFEPARVTRTFCALLPRLTRTMPKSRLLRVRRSQRFAHRARRARDCEQASLRPARGAPSAGARSIFNPPFCRVLLSFDASIGDLDSSQSRAMT